MKSSEIMRVMIFMHNADPEKEIPEAVRRVLLSLFDLAPEQLDLLIDDYYGKDRGMSMRLDAILRAMENFIGITILSADEKRLMTEAKDRIKLVRMGGE